MKTSIETENHTEKLPKEAESTEIGSTENTDSPIGDRYGLRFR